MRTPIAFIIFNRPGNAEKVFETIRQAKPSKLFVIADGPRPDHPDDLEKCAATRAIIDRVDWDCEVFKNFADKNLGCGVRPATGINWVFENVEEAIILEDDCIPHPTFFSFCEELLEKYRFDQRVMHISGNNYWSEKYRRDHSYVFSRYILSWGWATWKRAWQHYDFDMRSWSEIKQKNILKDLLVDQHVVNNWSRTFQRIIDTNLDCWDYQWTLTCWLQSGFAVLPHVNLVSNIGFGADATHTNSAADCPQMNVPTEAVNFPLKHPKLIICDAQIDQFIQANVFDYHPKLLKRVKRKLHRMLKSY